MALLAVSDVEQSGRRGGMGEFIRCRFGGYRLPQWGVATNVSVWF